MKIYEIDWRHSSTRRVLHALSDALEDTKHEFHEAQEEHERDDALEYAERVSGLTFVTAQAYIDGTVSDVKKITKSTDKSLKARLLKACDDRLSGSLVTRIELCDAMANYFKHHEQWPDWSATGRRKATVSVLHAAGITDDDNYPCLKAAKMLSLDQGDDMEALVALISGWRASVIADCKN
jgi:hypothetical protein